VATPRAARVVQISDTHFRSTLPPPVQWPAVVDWLAADPPDLLVHTGDIVYEDPDDEADRAFAKTLLDQSPVPYVVIPGNHDIGSFDEEPDRDRRLQAFRTTWGDDRFSCDVAGWRLVGVDAYLLGTTEHDEWLRGAVDVDRPSLVFVHQPLRGDQADGWEMPPAPRQAFERAVQDADVRIVASGHRHCSWRTGRAVWAPSLTLSSPDAVAGADPRPGLVEHTLSAAGVHEHRVVRPWALTA
jgi:alkaline phosphatase D